MSKPLSKKPWKAIQCPKGCGAWWNHWIHIHRGGAVCRVYWNRTTKWGRAPFDNKPCASFRVRINPETNLWEKHPTHPAWQDRKPVKLCCKAGVQIVKIKGLI